MRLAHRCAICGRVLVVTPVLCGRCWQRVDTAIKVGIAALIALGAAVVTVASVRLYR